MSPIVTRHEKGDAEYVKIEYMGSPLAHKLKVIMAQVPDESGTCTYLMHISDSAKKFAIKDFSAIEFHSQLVKKVYEPICDSTLLTMDELLGITDFSSASLETAPKVEAPPERIYEYSEYLVAVYGSLRRGGALHEHLKGARFAKKMSFTGFTMHDKDGQYPYIATGKVTDKIMVEIYRVSWETMKLLDEVEDDGGEYTRKLIPSTDVWMYYPTDMEKARSYPQVPMDDAVDCVDWIEYFKNTYGEQPALVIDSHGHLNIAAE